MKTKVLIYSFLILLICGCFTENRTKITGGVDDVVKIVVADILMIDNNINDNTNLRNDLGADELDMVEITMEIEYQYDLIISDNDMDKFYTISDLIMYIEKNQH
jgi:acyl carrier protein